MIIDGKEYTVKSNVKLKYLRLVGKPDITTEEFLFLTKGILEPSPSDEELGEFTEDDIIEIFATFNKKRQEKQASQKKKFGQ